MFTGLVETMGKVAGLQADGPGVHLVIQCPSFTDVASFTDIKVGESVAINGCCLTVVEHQEEMMHFEAGAETLRRTNLGRLDEGDSVNLERAMQVGARLGGHFVSGHIDTVATVDERTDDENWSTFWFKLPSEWTRHMASKGSVTVDGVSLTLVEVQADRFSVALIPHTLQVTTLGDRQLGSEVNVETDILAKYVESLLEHK
jgi:riboflavin synthase